MWLARHQEGGFDQSRIDGFEVRLAEADEQCREVVTKAFEVNNVHSVLVERFHATLPHGRPVIHGIFWEFLVCTYIYIL